MLLNQFILEKAVTETLKAILLDVGTNLRKRHRIILDFRMKKFKSIDVPQNFQIQPATTQKFTVAA